MSTGSEWCGMTSGADLFAAHLPRRLWSASIASSESGNSESTIGEQSLRLSRPRLLTWGAYS